MSRWGPAVAVLIGLAMVTPAVANAVEKNLAVTPYEQEKTNWCWAAASKMIIKFKTGATVSQCNIVKYAKGTSACNNVGGTRSDVMTVLDHWGVNPGVQTDLTWDEVKAEMNTNRPIYSTIDWRSGGGHAHVIRGFYNTGYSYGVSYIDPWTGTRTSREWGTYKSNSQWVTDTALIHLYAE